jgi:hypothetical protein
MFAILALLAFAIALFGGSIGNIDLVILGFCFIALHLIVPLWWVNGRPGVRS